MEIKIYVPFEFFNSDSYDYDTSLCYSNSIIIIEEEQLMTSILIME